MNDLDRLLSIQETRGYYDYEDIYKKEYDSLKSKIESELNQLNGQRKLVRQYKNTRNELLQEIIEFKKILADDKQ